MYEYNVGVERLMQRLREVESLRVIYGSEVGEARVSFVGL